MEWLRTPELRAPELRASNFVEHRSCFLERVERCAASGRGCVLLRADVDRLKEFNKNYVRPEGSRLLQRAATMLADALPPESAFCASDQHEFLILLPGRDLEAGLAVAQAVVEGARRLGTPWWFKPVWPSMGVAAVALAPGSKSSAEALHRAVDLAAYTCWCEGGDVALGATRLTEDLYELVAHQVTPLDPKRPGRYFRAPVQTLNVPAALHVPESAWTRTPETASRLARWLDDLPADDDTAFCMPAAPVEAQREALDAEKRALLGLLFRYPHATPVWLERAVERCLERVDQFARRAGLAVEIEPPPALQWDDEWPPEADVLGHETLADRWTAHPPELQRLLFLLSEYHRIVLLDDERVVLEVPPEAAYERRVLETAWARRIPLIRPGDIEAELARVGLTRPCWFEVAHDGARSAMDVMLPVSPLENGFRLMGEDG